LSADSNIMHQLQREPQILAELGLGYGKCNISETEHGRAKVTTNCLYGHYGVSISTANCDLELPQKEIQGFFLYQPFV